MSTIIDYFLHLLIIFIFSSCQFIEYKSTKIEDLWAINPHLSRRRLYRCGGVLSGGLLVVGLYRVVIGWVLLATGFVVGSEWVWVVIRVCWVGLLG